MKAGTPDSAPARSKYVALRVAGIYGFIGGLWILLSDNLAVALAPDVETFARIQMYKGWFFIAASTLLIYLLVRRDAKYLRRSERKLQETEERYRRLLGAANDAIIVIDVEHGTVLDLNIRAQEILGVSAEEITGRPHGEIYPPDEADRCRAVIKEAVESGRMIERVDLYDRRAGRRIPTEVSASVVHAGGRTVFQGIFREITESERALEESARSAAENAEEARRARFLAEANSILAASLDYQTTLRTVSHLAVPTLADWCVVDIAEEDGSIRRLAAAHADPARDGLAQQLTRFPPDPSDPGEVHRALRTEEPVLHPEISPERLRAMARAAEHQRVLHELGAVSLMIVPLIAHGRVLGALTLATSDSDRRYGPDDVGLAREFARRAALALDNARIYQTRLGEQAGNDAPARERVDLAALVREAAALVEPAAVQKGIQVRVQAEGAALAVETDADTLREVLIRVLSALVTATDTGQVELSAQEENGMALLRVRSTELQLPSTEADRVFDPFWERETEVSAGEQKPTLALASTREAAGRFGGELDVESRPGEGTAITIRIPASA